MIGGPLEWVLTLATPLALAVVLIGARRRRSAGPDSPERTGTDRDPARDPADRREDLAT